MEELAERDEQEGREDGIKLPSMEIARTFAVETIDYPTPLGLQYVPPLPILFLRVLAYLFEQPAHEMAEEAHGQPGRLLP